MEDTPPLPSAPSGKSGNFVRGYEGKHGEELPGPRNITKLSNSIEVPGSYNDIIGVIVKNLVKVGGKPKGVRDVLKGGGVGSTYFWVGEVDDDPHMGQEIWGFQHRVAICITGRHPLQFMDVSW